MDSPWQTHSSKSVYKNKWIEVVENQVTMPDGKPGIYGVVHVIDCVFLIALTDDNRVHLVHQFRYPRQAWAWELPAGGIDDGKEPLEAAQAELREELGLEAAKWELIGKTTSSITGVTDDAIHVYIATGLQNVPGTTHQAEGISQTKSVTVEELFHLVDDGELADAQSVASLMYFQRWLDKRNKQL